MRWCQYHTSPSLVTEPTGTYGVYCYFLVYVEFTCVIVPSSFCIISLTVALFLFPFPWSALGMFFVLAPIAVFSNSTFPLLAYTPLTSLPSAHIYCSLYTFCYTEYVRVALPAATVCDGYSLDRYCDCYINYSVQAGPCRICGRQRGTETGFLRALQDSPRQWHSENVPLIRLTPKTGSLTERRTTRGSVSTAPVAIWSRAGQIPRAGLSDSRSEAHQLLWPVRGWCV